MWKGKDKMLKLVTLLEKRDTFFSSEKPYNSRMHFYTDGTSADAASLWATANADRWDVYRGPFKAYPYPALRNLDDLLTPSLRLTAKGYIGSSIRTLWSLMFDFDLPMQEVMLIFNTGGCADAKTAENAARYIKGFIEGYEERLKLVYEGQTNDESPEAAMLPETKT